MNNRKTLVAIALAPVFVALATTYYFVSTESKRLSIQTLETLEDFLIKSKQQELYNYTNVALTAVDHIYAPSRPDNVVAQNLVADIFDSMSYNGNDGYFFIYDDKGTNIVHPKQAFRIGENWWELKDVSGALLIQDLIHNAKAGGGYYRYLWEKPSTHEVGEKISYSTYMDKWDWMIGTGVYLDDINQQLGGLQSELDDHIDKTARIILSVAISIMLIIAIIGLILNLTEKKQADLKLNALSQRIVDLQEEERRRISHELHDGIVQILVSIKYYFESMGLDFKKQKIESPAQMKKASESLDMAISEIRRISHDLHPRILDELGLSEAIETISNEFSKRTGINVVLKKLALRKLLPVDLSTSLYRVVQESLTNIERHSTATKVVITVSIEKNWLVLDINDNGTQKNKAKERSLMSSGIGLRNLAERIEYHSGQFEAEFSHAGGRVRAKIPIALFKTQVS